MRTCSIRPRLGRMLAFVAVLASSLLPAPAGPAAYLKRPDAWFASAEGRNATANILSHQSPLGGWPKNTDTAARRFESDRNSLRPTFDNGATTDELRFLARAFNATRDAACRTAVERGLDYILAAQYPTGGWPQFHPPGSQYHRHITYNDGAMVRLLNFLREAARADGFAFLDAARRQSARAAFDRGIACIVKCQVIVDGHRTAWCAQHDEVDLRPRPGRTYELVSLSGSESVGIVRLLMSLETPGPEIVRAVDAAVAWFEAVRISGIRVVEETDEHAPKGKNKVVVKDPAAHALWARFYEIGTHRPLFADRDGVAKFTLAEIGYERRNGYAWYGTWPQDLLAKEYPDWKKRVSEARH